MLKALCPVATMLTLFAFQLEQPTPQLIGSVLIIAAGTGLASAAEGNFVVMGVIIMIISIQADALRLVLIQYVMTNLSSHPMVALKSLAPACTAWMLLGTYLFEYSAMLEANAFGKMVAKPWLYLVAASMGFAVNSLCYIAIKLTSSLTIKVVGVAKDAGVVLCSVLMLGERVTKLQVAGYMCALGGFGLYNYVKYRMAEAARDAAGALQEKLMADKVSVQELGKGMDGEEQEGLLDAGKPDLPRRTSSRIVLLRTNIL